MMAPPYFFTCTALLTLYQMINNTKRQRNREEVGVDFLRFVAAAMILRIALFQYFCYCVCFYEVATGCFHRQSVLSLRFKQRYFNSAVFMYLSNKLAPTPICGTHFF
jgi:hypothetical protein